MKRVAKKSEVLCATSADVAKKKLFDTLRNALYTIDDLYSQLEGEYKNELDSCYEEIEILVRELDAEGIE